jgi:hypothetical protein
VRERERQAAQRAGKLARGALVTRASRAFCEVDGRGVFIENVDHEHRSELAHA